LTTTAFATDYYVAPAPAGAPGNSGTEASPKTLAEAAKIAVAGDRVLLKAGVYRETAEIQKDGATFMAAPGVSASDVIINGTNLMQTWTAASGSTYSTPMSWDLDTEVNTNAALPSFTNGRRVGTNQVFQDGRMMELLRWPKRPVALLDTAMTLMNYNAEADNMVTPGTAAGVSYNQVTITDADLSTLPNPQGWVGAKIWINLSQKNSGIDGIGKTGTVTSISGNTMIVNMPGYGVRSKGEAWGVGPGSEYFLFDPTPTAVGTDLAVLNQMLAPGEWWRNSANATLYVKTRTGAQPGNAETALNKVEVKRRHFGFWPDVNNKLNRHSYTIQDLTLFACAITTDRQFTVSGVNEGARDITLQRLTFKYPSHFIDFNGSYVGQHEGWSGIVVSGRRNIIQDCDISFSAGSALSVVGADHKVLRNLIHETNYLIASAGALNTGFLCIDTEIAYNRVWNTTEKAINVGGGINSNPDQRHKFRVHHNTIYDFMLQSYDSGAIDAGLRDFRWGRFDHNTIYNTRPEGRIGGRKYGIYFDYGTQAEGIDKYRMRITIDHNVVYDVNNAATINAGWDVHVFNNVLLTVDTPPPGSNPESSTGLNLGVHLGNEKVGTNVLAFNNILSEPPAPHYEKRPGTLVLNNITNAKGTTVLNELFVDATNANRAARNYRLKSTANRAIDKGIEVDEYTNNYPLDRPVVGVTDIGAFEHPTSTVGADNQAPSVPVATNFVVTDKTGNSFRVSWRPSTDNVRVAFYEVHLNGKFFKSTNDTTFVLTQLTGSTTYSIKVLAVDGSGNRSALSAAQDVTTLAPVVDVDIAKTTTPPNIDGNKEAAWGATLSIDKIVTANTPTPATSPTDLSGSWTSLWDDNNLYLFIDVKDDVTKVNSGNDWWEDDHIEIFIDAEGTRLGTGYGTKQFQYYMLRGSNTTLKETKNASTSLKDVVAKMVDQPGVGYRLELKIPFSTLGVTPRPLATIGFEVHIGDDDDDEVPAETRQAWFSTNGNVYALPSLMGLAKLVTGEDLSDNEKPSVPTGVTAGAISPTAFTLNWTASTDNFGVANYEVFVDGNLVGTPIATTFTLEGLTAATTYTVQVRAKDRYDQRSDYSSVLKVTTPTRTVFDKYESEDAELYNQAGNARVETRVPGYSDRGYVYGISAHTAGGSITYTVNVPTAGTYAAFLRYNGNGRLSLFVNGTRVSDKVQFPNSFYNSWEEELGVMTLPNLRAGENKVMLLFESGGVSSNGPLQDYLGVFMPGADSQAPTAPTNLTVSNTTTSGFTLSWTGSTDNSGATPSYQVYSNGALVATTTNTTYSLTSLSPGTYAITVKAVDARGNQSDGTRVVEVDLVGSSAVDRTDPVGSGTITVRGENPNRTNERRAQAFDNNPNTKWLDFSVQSWIQFQFDGAAQYAINKYTITSANDEPARDPRDWKLYGTNAANPVFPADYTEVDSRSGVTFENRFQKKEFSFSNSTEYRAYRLVISANRNAGLPTAANMIQLSEIELFTPAPGPGIPARTVAVTPTSISVVNPGVTRQLEAIIAPVNATNKTVIWSSSNPAIATVSSTGLVTSTGFGTATITATTAETGKKATASITVTRDWTKVDNNQANSGITYDANWGNYAWSGAYAGTLHGSSNEAQLPEATFTFTGGRVKFYGATRYNLGIADVYLDGRKIATVDQYGNNGEEIYDRMLWDSGELAFGAHTVKIIATNTTNRTAPRLDRWLLNTIIIDAFEYSIYSACTTCRVASAEVASNSKAEGQTLQLYPNPANQEVTIDLSGFAGETAVQVKMSDMTGKAFLGQQVQLGAGVDRVTLPVNHLPQGLFFVTVQGSKTTKTAKLVINK
jgi:chitodextrinase